MYINDDHISMYIYRSGSGADGGGGGVYAFISAAEFHKQTNILVTALTDGSFFLHEMPSFTHIHSLRCVPVIRRRAVLMRICIWMYIYVNM